MQTFKIASYILIILMLNACISKYEYTSNQNLPQDDFRYLDLISVKTKRWSFTLIDFQKKNLMLQSKKDLYLLNKLESNQNFINQITELKTTYVLGLFKRQELTLTVDKIEYIDQYDSIKFNQNYLNKINFNDSLNFNLMKFGDTIIYKSSSFENGNNIESAKCTFISLNKENNSAFINRIDKNGINNVEKVNLDDIYTFKIRNYKSFELSKIIDIKTKKSNFYNVAICAFGINTMLIIEHGEVYKIRYDEILK